MPAFGFNKRSCPFPGTRGLAILAVAIGSVAAAVGTALADGMVFSPEVHAQIQIPNQQALIHFADGVEDLVIETSFLGAGTNFAWVVPLPSVPEIQPVSENLFPGLQRAFQPRLIHEVRRYYLAVLFLCGLGFLAWRCFKDEVSVARDIPLCVLMAAGVGLVWKSWLLAAIAFGFIFYARAFTRSTVSLTMVLLIGMGLAASFTLVPDPMRSGLIQTMGAESGYQTVEGVKVVSVQHAGIFDSATIHGSNPRAILEWLAANGYDAPPDMEPVVRRYVEDSWVFVASKARRDNASVSPTALHPLAFKFATPAMVYPMKLTATGKGSSSIDLFVFGDKRASASRFQVVRCDRIAKNWRPGEDTRWKSWLRFSDPDIFDRIGHSTVGTKLSARLTPDQMASDVTFGRSFFLKKGAWAYSESGAVSVALNVALTLAPASWLLVGACRGSWGVDEKFVRRWRARLLAAAIVIGIVVFLWLPKVAVEIVQYSPGMD